MTLARIGTFWSGPPLSWLEQLCLSSFVEQGHEVTVFGYETVGNLPHGVRFADAAEILPSEGILRHERTGSPAFHADIFRLRMIRDTGMVWADTDAYCVRPWEVTDHGFFFGLLSDRKPMVGNGVLGLPPESETLARLIEFTSDPYAVPPWYSETRRSEMEAARARGEGLHVSALPWGAIGPDALTHFLKVTGEISHAFNGDVLYPVPFRLTRFLVEPQHASRARRMVSDNTISIHFYGRRIRNLMSERGGIPPEDGIAGALLARHGIDPADTAHLFESDGPAASPDVADVEFGMLDDADISNLLLQRSEAVKLDPLIRAWSAGDTKPLRDYASAHRGTIAPKVFDVVQRASAPLIRSFGASPPATVVDIGPGYGFAGLLLYRAFGSRLILVDVEDADERNFGFGETASAYSNLDRARAFLEGNGVPGERIKTVNPTRDGLEGLSVPDALISMKACGFHFPVSVYENLLRSTLEAGGTVILDIRKGSGGIPALRRMGKVTILEKNRKLTTVRVVREHAHAGRD